jgi:hypothetical protein
MLTTALCFMAQRTATYGRKLAVLGTPLTDCFQGWRGLEPARLLPQCAYSIGFHEARLGDSQYWSKLNNIYNDISNQGEDRHVRGCGAWKKNIEG